MKLRQMLRRVRSRLAAGSRGDDDVRWYLAHGRRPWSRGYEGFRNSLVSSVIADPEALRSIRHRRGLPAGYGLYLDERVVELPWLFANLAEGPAMILDAGSALNSRHLVGHHLLRDKKLHIATLAPEESCFWRLGVSYLFSDLRSLPYADGVFDQVACISTLEHVGKDNTLYAPDGAFRENRSSDFEVAMREMARVCRRGGQLLLSVPFGRFTDFGWYQQFDSSLLDRAIAAFGPADVEESFFRYTDDGWTLADRDSCADCEGFNIHATKYFNPESSRDYDPDFAAASRGIAAIILTKRG